MDEGARNVDRMLMHAIPSPRIMEFNADDDGKRALFFDIQDTLRASTGMTSDDRQKEQQAFAR